MILIKWNVLLIFLSGVTVTLSGALRSRNLSSIFHSERNLQDDSDLCPSKKPRINEECSGDHPFSCQYEPYFRCKGDKKPFYLSGCSCFGGTFMCYQSSMLPCEDSLDGDLEDEISIQPYESEDENKVGDEVTTLPYDSEDENKVGDEITTLPYDSEDENKVGDEVTTLPYEKNKKGEESDKVSILPYESDDKEDESDKVSILPYEPDEKGDESDEFIIPINPDIPDDISTRPLFPGDIDKEKNKKGEECPEQKPAYGDACSLADGIDKCEYAPDVKCKGSDKTHHVNQCYCEEGSFYCTVAMIICEDSYTQPKGCPAEKPRSGVDKCKTKAKCKYDPKEIPGEKEKTFQTECFCAGGTFMCSTTDIYPQPFKKNDDTALCGPDVKTCSDGTFVLRDPDNKCDFPPCPMDADFPPPYHCIECDDRQSKSMKKKSKECFNYTKKQLAKRCSKLGWLTRGYCRKSCVVAGFTTGREECCGAATAQ